MPNKRKQHTQTEKYFDYSLLFIVIFLLGFGLVMIYSTSSYSASLSQDGDGLFYLRKQLISTIIGLVFMMVVSFIPFKYYVPLAPIIYGFSIFSVLLVLTPLGYEANGAKRWIRLFGLSIQPAEIVKIGVILVTAFILLNYKDAEDAVKNSWKYVFGVLAPAALGAGLILVITNNLSSAIIVGGIAYFMLVIANPRCYKAYILLAALAVLAVGAVVYLYISVSNSSNVTGLNFRFERILAWFNPEQYADGTGFQTLQSLYGIGSGGMVGKGLGKSMQKLGFLPEASNDMIFSVICEELGFAGGIAIMCMFLLLLYRLFDISRYVKNFFGNLLIVGVFCHIAIQVVLNIAVVTNTIPNTGISLPFISYGGTSVIFLLGEIGIVMNVAKGSDFSLKRKNRGARTGSNQVRTEQESIEE